MPTTISIPSIDLAGGQSGNPAGQDNPGSLELAYQNLLSDAAGVADGANPKALILSAAAITSAASFEVGLTETASEVANNLSVLKQIANFCTVHHISVLVEANLTQAGTWSIGAGSGHNELVDQWAQVAAMVGLPITQVEDVQEIATACPASSFADFASVEANAVRTLVEDYSGSDYTMTSSSLAVGDMEGGPPGMNMSTLTQYWNAYNGAATALGMPEFSFTTSDTGWFGPWIGTLSVPSWQAYLTTLSTTAAADNMTLNVLVQGAETSTSAGQFVLQAEQNAADLARLAATGAVNVGAIMVQSWQQQPVSVDLITSPTSSVNEAAEIRAFYPLYAAGLVTAQGTVSLTAPGQLVLNTNTTQRISPFSLTWAPADVGADTRLGIVIIDQTGSLAASKSGTGTVSNLAANILILNGDSVDLAAELNSITLTEPNAGPDLMDIEIYGAAGRVNDTQINILAAAPGQSVSNIATTNNSQGWLTSSAILNSGTVITSHSNLISETLTWSVTGALTDPVTDQPIPGVSAFLNTVSIHEPLAEYGVEQASGSLLGTTFNAVADIFDPSVDNGVSPANGYANNAGINNVSVGPLAGWLPASFDPAAQLVALIVKSTTNAFDPNSGKLEQSVDLLAPDPLTVVDKAGTHTDTFATAFNNGGRQVTEFNTGNNAAWMQGWGSQFSSATLTYDSGGQLVELFLQGGAANPLFTIDDVFDPSNGHLWEEFQSTTPPPEAYGTNNYATTTNPYQAGFATGPLYVSEIDTGDNPNWGYLDWGSTAGSDTEVWTDNFIMANSSGFGENFPAHSSGDLNAYSPEFVDGATLDVMYLPGTVAVNLSNLRTITLDSQSMACGLSGLNAIDAWGDTGNVTIGGSAAGGSTLIGGDGVSTISGFGHDNIVSGSGNTIINTGAGDSAITVSSADGRTSIKGDGNVVTVARGGTVIETGKADILTYLAGGTLTQQGQASSSTVTGSHVTVWMATSGGSVAIAGDSNQVTGWSAATISMDGSDNVAGVGAGCSVAVQGQGNIVYGTGIAVSASSGSSAPGSATVSVFGNKNTITAAPGSVVKANGTGDTLNGSGFTVLVSAANAGSTVCGGRGGATMEITSGGTASLNSADINVTVILDVPTHLTLGALSFITVVGASSGHDTITAGGQHQTLQSIGGHDTLIGSPAFGATFLGSMSGLKGDTIRNFGGSDVIDITDLGFVGLKPLSFNTASGTLTAANKTSGIALVMQGYGLAHFTAQSDGHGGTLIGSSR